MKYASSLKPALLLTFVASGAFAQNYSTDTGWTVGAIGTFSTPFFVGEDDLSFDGFPFISYETERFYAGFDELSYNFISAETRAAQNDVSILLQPRFSDIESADSSFLAGMDRDFTLDLGLNYELTLERGGTTFGATFLQEITGEHDGQELILRVSQPINGISSFPVAVEAGGRWQSGDLSQYLYGVYANEAVVGRPQYEPGSVFIPFIGASAIIPLSRNWALISTVEISFLPNDVQNSPIIDEDVIFSGALGIAYRF